MLSLHRSTWNPWKDFSILRRELDRAFQEVLANPSRVQRQIPPVNVWKGDDGVIVTAPVPGAELNDIDISVLKDTLTIRVQPKATNGPPDGTIHRHERTLDPFARTIVLPFEVDAHKTEAKFERGILSIKLQRPEALKPTKVTVTAA